MPRRNVGGRAEASPLQNAPSAYARFGYPLLLGYPLGFAMSWLGLAGGANQGFHVVQVALEGAAAGGCEAVFSLG